MMVPAPPLLSCDRSEPTTVCLSEYAGRVSGLVVVGIEGAEVVVVVGDCLTGSRGARVNPQNFP